MRKTVLKFLPNTEQILIILTLASNPRPKGCKKLTDKEGYRVRIGNYRILYSIDDEARIVVICRIKVRGKTTYK